MSRPLTLADQFAQLKQQRSIMIGLLFLLVIVVCWIGIGLFSSQQKFAVPKALRDLARPLSPILDEDTLAALEQKRFFPAEELRNFTIYKVVVNDVSKQLRLVDIASQADPTLVSTGGASAAREAVPTAATTPTSSESAEASQSLLGAPGLNQVAGSAANSSQVTPTTVPTAATGESQ